MMLSLQGAYKRLVLLKTARRTALPFLTLQRKKSSKFSQPPRGITVPQSRNHNKNAPLQSRNHNNSSPMQSRNKKSNDISPANRNTSNVRRNVDNINTYDTNKNGNDDMFLPSDENGRMEEEEEMEYKGKELQNDDEKELQNDEYMEKQLQNDEYKGKESQNDEYKEKRLHNGEYTQIETDIRQLLRSKNCERAFEVFMTQRAAGEQFGAKLYASLLQHLVERSQFAKFQQAFECLQEDQIPPNEHILSSVIDHLCTQGKFAAQQAMAAQLSPRVSVQESAQESVQELAQESTQELAQELAQESTQESAQESTLVSQVVSAEPQSPSPPSTQIESPPAQQAQVESPAQIVSPQQVSPSPPAPAQTVSPPAQQVALEYANQAELLLKQMLEYKIIPNPRAYTSLVSCMLTAGQPERAMHVISLMSPGSKYTQQQRASVASHYARSAVAPGEIERIDNAERMARELHREGARSYARYVYNSIAQQLFTLGVMGRAHETLRFMFSQKWNPSVGVWFAAVDSTLNSGDLETGSRLFERYSQYNKIAEVVAESFIAALCRQGLVNHALQWVVRLRREKRFVPSRSIYTFLIGGFTQLGDPGNAEQVLRVMLNQAKVKAGGQPPLGHYNIVLEGYVVQRNLRDTERLYYEMKSANLVPSVRAASFLMETFANRNNVEKMEKLLEEMKVRRADLSVPLLSTLVRVVKKPHLVKFCEGQLRRQTKSS